MGSYMTKGAYTLRDIASRTPVLEVRCAGWPVRVARLVERFGSASDLTPWFRGLTADARTGMPAAWYTPCDLHCQFYRRRCSGQLAPVGSGSYPSRGQKERAASQGRRPAQSLSAASSGR